MVGAVLDKTGELDIIPKDKIRSLIGSELSENALMGRLESESAPIRRWTFFRFFILKEMSKIR